MQQEKVPFSLPPTATACTLASAPKPTNPAPFSFWQKRTVYFVLTDRFVNR
ncbi:hypothetical protein KIF59_09720 [Enterobacter cloacae subsp. cloacae]|nr:hypothetical protein [Enterobacter cloacae subsp. cloacae]